MSFGHWLRQKYQRFKLRRSFSDAFWIDYFTRKPMPFGLSSGSVRGGLYFKDYGLDLDQHNSLLFLENSRYVKSLVKFNAANFSTENSRLHVTIDGIKMQLDDHEEFYIVQEVFGRRLYGWNFCRPTLVIDVGMNVGFSSLYFSNSDNVHVVGYEPFQQTYNQALRNIEANPTHKTRIEPIHAALGGHARKETWRYFPRRKGSSGKYTMLGFEHESESELVPITILDADTELTRLLERFQNQDVVLKLDCEGGEHEILARLSETSALQKVTAILMEWHARASSSLQDTLGFLESANFNYILLNGDTLETRIIYAVNRKQRLC
jgi:FkbM family methyltransferase